MDRDEEPDVLRWAGGAATAAEIESALRRRLTDMGYQVSRYVYAPGTRFPPHSHGVDKIDCVLAGRFRVTLPGRTVVLEPGDAVRVPKGAVHDAEVVGDEAVVSLDAVKL